MNAATGPRRLGELIGRLEAGGVLRSVQAGGAVSPATAEIRGVTHDSRRVEPGWLFVAIPGQHQDGHDFAALAAQSGAGALLLERGVAVGGIPQLLVTDARRALAVAAAWYEGDPSHRLGIVGITGTDGKTTTAYLVRAMLEACGLATGMLGTIDVVIGGQSLGNPGRATTPEAPELQARLRQMVDAGDRVAIVESTSHGLAQERVGEVAYDVGVFTNVTHEHLEFHRTPDAYRAAKRRLFERLAVGPANPEKGYGKHAVINADDAWAALYIEAAREAGARLVTYGAQPGTTPTIRATSVRETATGLGMRVETPRWDGDVTLRLAGRFNAHNALAAIGVGEALDLDPGTMRDGLATLDRVPGRMELIDAGQPFRVVVDYAHTADALSKALDDLAPFAASSGGGLIAVFGSAGDRDVDKRPAMGRVAADRCRIVVVTDEDPRSEDRESILAQIAAGAERAGHVRGHDLLLIADRREAIGTAIGMARPGDVVLLAGKGHERTIEMAGEAISWDEAGAALDALDALGYSRRAEAR